MLLFPPSPLSNLPSKKMKKFDVVAKDVYKLAN